jgi:hypothetical protein
MAVWVNMDRKFDWRVPGKRAMKSFPPGEHYMTEEQATEAERVGAGTRMAERPEGKKVTKAGQTANE